MKPRPVRLKILPTAAQEIVEQAEYYRSKADDTLASKWQTDVLATIQSLLTLPERGPQSCFATDSIKALRHIAVRGFPKHLVFYQYIEDQRDLIIVSVLHGARDLEALLTTRRH